MKKFFLIAAAAALVLSACSKNNVSENTSEANAITFGTYTGRSVTKADADAILSGTEFPTGKHFGVYGYLINGLFKDATAPKPSFMNPYDVNYAGPATATTKYWPSNDALKLTFYAYYPYGNSNVTPLVTSGLGSYTVTVPTTSASQPDFMLTDVVPDQTYDATNSDTKGVVNLLFRHMLTKVQVAAKIDASNALDGTVIKIKSVTFSGIDNVVNVTPSFDGTSGKTTFGTDNAGSTATTYTADLGSEALTTGGTTPTLANTLLLAPQDLTNGKLTIVYTVTSNDGTTPVEITKVIDLKDYTSGKWVSNESVLYSFTINIFDTTRPIKFTATVAEWSTQETPTVPTI
jgi:hypothetical protein